MFGGIVECIAKIKTIIIDNGCKVFTFIPEEKFNDIKIGDSIAINGVCLTVTEFDDVSFKMTAVPETLRLTNLDQLIENTYVNAERALQYQQRIGGHYVQGHVDTTAEIIAITEDNSNAWLVKFKIDAALTKYIVKKGFITIDGMSITIIDVGPDWFSVTLIPHTQLVTIAKDYRIGSKVNIEVDLTAKYIEKLLGERKAC